MNDLSEEKEQQKKRLVDQQTKIVWVIVALGILYLCFQFLSGYLMGHLVWTKSQSSWARIYSGLLVMALVFPLALKLDSLKKKIDKLN